MKSRRILNGKFDVLDLRETIDEIYAMIARGDRGWLCTVNVAILMMARDDQRLQAFIDRAAITVADGQPLVWLSRLRGEPLPERVAGVDLVEEICRRAARDRVPVYLLGAERPIVEGVADRMRRDHPGLDLIGVGDGYFSEEEAPARARQVAESGARILIVAMGVPRQEHFIEDYWEELGVGFAIGVGGSFDVISGQRDRAPLWVQRIGFEWAYRLIQEPRRLFMRYLVTNSRFVALVIRDLLTPHRSPATR